MKRLVFWLIYILNIHKFFRYIYRHKLAILLYHGVEQKINWGTYNYRGKFITPESFKRQIAYLKKNYNILKLDEAIKYLSENQKLPSNSLVITFDDGYKNFYNLAYPIIKSHQLPVTVFLSTDFIDKKSPLWTDRLEYTINMCQDSSIKSVNEKVKTDIMLREKMKMLPEKDKEEILKSIEIKCGKLLNDFLSETKLYAPLSWEDVINAAKEGVIFGAHTKTHPILTKVSKEQAETEIKESKKILQVKLERISGVFSYPNGQKNDFDEEIKTLVKNQGFQAALTTIPGFNDSASDLFSLKRLTMDKTDDFAEFLLTISGIKLFLQKIKKYARRS